MELILKIIGIILILAVSTLAGFLKAYCLKERETALNEVCISLKELKERIRLERSKLDRLLKICFGDCLCISGKEPIIKKDGLEDQDKELLYEYLSLAGMSDAAAECERLELYIHLFEEKCIKATEKRSRLSKLYRSSGFLIGLFICIFIV
ncbi:MAG: hypothetical protein IJ470_05190 [Clostridia bacterium]|nr:hypothetical protein [Clostridia bacterium]